MRKRLVYPAAIALTVAGFLACSDDPAPPADDPSPDAGSSEPESGASTDGGGGVDAATAAPTFFKSGTRLKIESLRADGHVFFQDFIDTKLGVRCNLTLTGDKTAVCVPEALTLTYADPGCTMPVVQRSACDKQKYVVTSTGDYCGHFKDIVVHPIGKAVAGTKFYSKTSDGTCFPNDAPEGTLFAIDPPIPDKLVSFTATTQPATAAIGRRLWVGDDTTELTAHAEYVDNAAKVDCSPVTLGLPDGGASAVCFPRKRAVHRTGFGSFSDAACTIPAGRRGVPASCGKPDVVLRREPGTPTACGVPFYFTAAAAGAEVVSGYELTGATCALQTVNAAQLSVWSLGPALPASNFVAVDPRRFGTGRLRADTHGIGDVQLGAGLPYDSARGQPCSPVRIAGDPYCTSDTRFAPTGGLEDFEDAACTKPITFRSTCTPNPPYAVAIVTPTACGGDYDVIRAVSATPLTITSYYRKQGGVCMGPEPIADGVAHAIGAAVDPATLFPKMTMVTE